MSPDTHRVGQGTAAGSDAAAVPPDAPAGFAEPAGHIPGAAVPEGEDGTAAPDLPAKVVALIQREAHMFDAVGSLIPRPPADVQSRLLFFHKTTVTIDQINRVLRNGKT